MNRAGMSRRRLLAQAATTLLAGPLVRMESRAAGAAPRRLICIFTPNGIHGEGGRCNTERDAQGQTRLDIEGPLGGPAMGTETAFSFGPYYSPLEAIKDKTIVMSRLTWAGPRGWGHIGGSRGPFTAWKGDTETDLPQVPSIDQFIAGELQKRGQITARRNLHYGIGDGGRSTTYLPFWSARDVGAFPVGDPLSAHASLFGGKPAATAARAITKRRLVDHALADCDRVMQRLDASGREVLGVHCANLEALGKTFAPSVAMDAGCAAPVLAATGDLEKPENYEQATTAFWDLVVGSFKCDLTRVAAFQFGTGAARLRLPFLNLKAAKQVDGYTADDHHTWTHHAGGQQEQTAALTEINRWYSRMVVALVQRLAATKDAAGQSLLDSTAILWLNEYGTGCQTGHDLRNIPGFLISGSSDFKRGRYLRLNHSTADHRALLTSMCHFMGLTDVRDYGFANDPSAPMTDGPFTRLYG